MRQQEFAERVSQEKSPATKRLENMRAESPYMNMTAAARMVGLCKSQLSEAAKEHPLYAPDFRGIPTGSNSSLGVNVTRYHIEHVRIIERVLLGAEDLETGWIRWQVKRNQILRGAA